MTVNASRMPPVNSNSVPTSGAIVETPLCFDKGLFERADFTVEKFIHLNRKRATLDQLQNDLRAFLRHVQNSMIELINDDYADFVNLSSNLAALNESIEKTAWEGFEQQTAKIKLTTDFVDQKVHEVAANRKQQIAIRNKIMFLSSLDRLAACLARRPSDLSSKWNLKVVHAIVSLKLWESRVDESELKPNAIIATEMCVTRARKILADDLAADLRGGCQHILSLYTSLALLNETEFATKVISNVVVKASVEVSGNDHVGKLKTVLQQLWKLRRRWVKNLQTHNQFTAEVEFFIDGIILDYVLAYLDDNLSYLCVPTDTSSFFSAYCATYEFFETFPRIDKHRSFLSGLRDRFNVVVYLKRLASPLKEELLARTANTTIVWHPTEGRLHPLDASDSLLKTLSTLYSDNCFLPVAANEFWEFTLYAIGKHNEWIEKCKNAEQPKVVDEISGSVNVREKWPDLVALVAGSKLFDLAFFNLCVTKVFVRFEGMGAEAEPFRQFLCDYSSELDAIRDDIRTKIIADILEISGRKLIQVSEIPKQYRWTKKPLPTQANDYVNEAFGYVENLQRQAQEKGWTPEWLESSTKDLSEKMVDFFCEHAGKVLSSVQQTGSSLQRFKRKGLASSESSSNVAATDEAKIRQQFTLDIALVKELSEKFGANTQKLVDLQTTLQQCES